MENIEKKYNSNSESISNQEASNKFIVILGGGESGSGAAVLAKIKGFRVFLSDMSCFSAMNGVYARFFSEKPARSTAAVSSLPRGVLVEIECIALAE